MNQITLNDKEYKFTENQLPSLIIYGDKSGGSHMTITLIAQLFESGSKILFFTAFPMAKDNFLEQVVYDENKMALVYSIDDFKKYQNKQVLILDSGNESLFIDVVKNIKDLNDRVVLVKNIEEFSIDLLKPCLDLERVILSGNIDMCIYKEEIIKKEFKSLIVFTKPQISLPFEVPMLEKYTGYLSSQNDKGFIKIGNK